MSFDVTVESRLPYSALCLSVCPPESIGCHVHCCNLTIYSSLKATFASYYSRSSVLMFSIHFYIQGFYHRFFLKSIGKIVLLLKLLRHIPLPGIMACIKQKSAITVQFSLKSGGFVYSQYITLASYHLRNRTKSEKLPYTDQGNLYMAF